MERAARIIDENECFTDDECVEFILNDLSDENRNAIRRHSTTCKECADLLDDYVDFDKTLTQAGQIDVAELRPSEAPVISHSSSKKKSDVVEVFYTTMPSKVGNLLVASTDSGLCRISFLGGVVEPSALFEKMYKRNFDLHRDDDRLSKAVTELKEYFSGERTSFDLPLDLSLAGTPFQRKVLETIGNIPFGKHWSYGELAREIGHPKAYRAVGSALGKNPIPIIVPCHRVMASGGKIGGYTGGLQIKRALMELEGIHL
ncbi:MAG TPA: methylated-DNA--[protein]-cysteine S-methyltransferase [Blastocatellia bacterium]|nr:methylated-DNA--[protein]-cysteine S-methyltransferase [Blastocatellia bacterium]